MYSLEFTKDARKQFAKLPRHIQRTIEIKFAALCKNPLSAGNVKALKGEAGSYRLRVGDYRVIFLSNMAVCVSLWYAWPIARRRINMDLHVQTFTQAGKSFVSLPADEFEELMESYTDMQDIRAVRDAKAAIAAGEETFPAKLVFALARTKTSGKKLKLWREHRGFSKAALGEEVAVNGQYISMIEAGKRKGTAALFKKCAKALDCSLDDLV